MTHSITLTLPSSSRSPLLPHHVSSSGNHSKDHKNVHSSPTINIHSSSRKSFQEFQQSTLYFVILILVWYSVSVGHNLLNKRLLEGDLFPFPFTLTLLQLGSITGYSYIYVKYMSSSDKHAIVSIKEVLSVRRNRTLVICLSSIKFLTLVFSHLSLSQVPLAFTHTVKGSLPLFVVLLSRIFLRHKHTLPVYLSLMPIVFGIGLASLHSPSKDPNMSWGIIFAFVSTFNLALLNVFSKKLLTTSFSAISLLHLITKFSLTIFVPFYICVSIFHSPEPLSLSFVTPILPLILLLDGFMSFSQNILAFTLLSMCSPLTYSIANCSKRVAIISLSFVFFSMKDISTTSIVGIVISLFGILSYNFAKHQEKKSQNEAASKSFELNGTAMNGFSSSYLTPSNSSTSLNINGHSRQASFDQYSIGSFYNV